MSEYIRYANKLKLAKLDKPTLAVAKAFIDKNMKDGGPGGAGPTQTAQALAVVHDIQLTPRQVSNIWSTGKTD